jgi:hypothetical protein
MFEAKLPRVAVQHFTTLDSYVFYCIIVRSLTRGVKEMADNIIAQSNWRWCSKCDGLWHTSSANQGGRCPAGGSHTSQGSGDYALFDKPATNFNSTIMAQPNWRWCAKCGGLWHPSSAVPSGVCPAGGAHTSQGSGDYALLNDSSGTIG